MPWWVMLFADGSVLYVGAALACAGLTLRCLANGRALGIAANSLVLTGAIGVGTSAAPLAWWLYAAWGAACAGALLAVNRPALSRRYRVTAATLFVAFSLLVCGIEGRHWLLPRLTIPRDSTALYVVGDSLSIGADRQE